jgi:predicted nucleic acid-binding protein
MPVYFLDTSALVKRYVAEAGSQTVTNLVNAADASVVVSDLTRAEFVSAVARRAREGSISDEQHRALKLAFAAHLVHKYLIAPLHPAHITAACGLIERHGLRAYDAVQLAVALSLRNLLGAAGEGPTLVCADPRLNAAARAEGLQVIEPAGS